MAALLYSRQLTRLAFRANGSKEVSPEPREKRGGRGRERGSRMGSLPRYNTYLGSHSYSQVGADSVLSSRRLRTPAGSGAGRRDRHGDARAAVPQHQGPLLAAAHAAEARAAGKVPTGQVPRRAGRWLHHLPPCVCLSGCSSSRPRVFPGPPSLCSPPLPTFPACPTHPHSPRHLPSLFLRLPPVPQNLLPPPSMPKDTQIGPAIPRLPTLAMMPPPPSCSKSLCC